MLKGVKAQSIVEQHSDVAKIITRFGKTLNYVNYSSFKGVKPIETNKNVNCVINEYKKDTIGINPLSSFLIYIVYFADIYKRHF